EALSRKFGEHVKATPLISREQREATFDFESSLAHIRLRFTAATDDDVRNIVLDYHLEIWPILMKFDPHQQVEFPLDAVDADSVARGIDDRFGVCVRTFVSLHQNNFSLQGHMVVDRVAAFSFPKFAAASVLDWKEKKFYFTGEKPRREFERQHGL